ncbi:MULTISPECIES: folate-binding protein [unclassified Chelatococcus]|uniref:CAF17-like 4Fe-4S cluster assembly/insertion protein YgfZ n=1 Tax=unclassified Chelatococcus TaxID=2638111 RepID=UPI001BD160F0|nr:MULTISPECIES: folate-binding protein [unclassified Chelatococcus]MBS7698315.1 folate-binding protein YgfZ [Chelatococcus sp. YT9]MBX3559172.1 folate-binding protein YgfZ [Chelatococcus sp.]
MPSALLADRGVIRISGADALDFLQNILTCRLDDLEPNVGRLGALLSPQGKILFDGLFTPAPEGGFFLDTAQAGIADFLKRLTLYKLRSKVLLEDLSETLAVAAGWDSAEEPVGTLIAYDDTRAPGLGRRFIGEREAYRNAGLPDAAAYHAHRIATGVPEGGQDFAFGDAFPHEAMMDQMGGVVFDKGCYIGQEVVSRMHHRGIARTRIVVATFADGEAPAGQTSVEAGGKLVGHLGSHAGPVALAMLRLDRVVDAQAAGLPLLADGRPLTVALPAYARVSFPTTAANGGTPS